MSFFFGINEALPGKNDALELLSFFSGFVGGANKNCLVKMMPFAIASLKLTASLPLKNGGWKTIYMCFPFCLKLPISGAFDVSFREGLHGNQLNAYFILYNFQYHQQYTIQLSSLTLF